MWIDDCDQREGQDVSEIPVPSIGPKKRSIVGCSRFITKFMKTGRDTFAVMPAKIARPYRSAHLPIRFSERSNPHD